MYINDLDIDLSSTVSKFADDTKLIKPIENQNDFEDLQADLCKLDEWSTRWQMSCNASKCVVLHFGFNNPRHKYHINNEEIQSSEEVKDLGVYFTTSMKAARQCSEAVKKTNRIIGLIKINFTNLNAGIVVSLYKTLIRPQLEYCIQVCRPYLQKDINLL